MVVAAAILSSLPDNKKVVFFRRPDSNDWAFFLSSWAHAEIDTQPASLFTVLFLPFCEKLIAPDVSAQTKYENREMLVNRLNAGIFLLAPDALHFAT